jgi:ketosteroid isomerase-like protein
MSSLMDTQSAARRWRDVWARAWPAKDADAIDALYTRDATYRSHPFRDPEPSPRNYVERMFAAEDEIECRFGEPIVSGDRAAVEWWGAWREAGEQVTLAGATVLRFRPDGLVAEHLDYWVQVDGRRALPPGWGG